MKRQPVQGLHHITAVASNPNKNIAFYQDVLGQRLVKRTVNFDDPKTYHLYYGDKVGSPGTIMTFFPWAHMRRGVRGVGETGATGYLIPPDAIPFWQERLRNLNIEASAPTTRFGETVISFADPDGMPLELITDSDNSHIDYWDNGDITTEHAVRGFQGVTLWVRNAEPTAHVLTELLGFSFVGKEKNRSRYRGASTATGLYIDLLELPKVNQGRFGAGSVHHIAFRTIDDDEQAEYLDRLRLAGLNVTPVQDRQYFHSIYFREPNGVLFEIATDAPGFLYDEPVDDLGKTLKLPSWLEPHRTEIERLVPELDMDKPV